MKLTTENPKGFSLSSRTSLLVGYAAVIALLGGFGYWSVTTKISGAVVSTGMIRVETNRQVVQHPDGGVVSEIRARDGDFVEEGETLIVLDDTLPRSDLTIVESQLHEILARSARLEAERDGLDSIIFPEELLVAAKENEYAAQQMSGQRRQFEAALESIAQEHELVDERISQIENRIDGKEAQLSALKRQLELTRGELANQKKLRERDLARSSTVSELESEEARIMGTIGELNAEVAGFRAEIAAAQIEKLQIMSRRSRDAITTLRDIQYSRIELAERAASLRDRLSRLEITAPVGGIVYGSNVFAVRSVLQPGEEIMYIIPQDQPLVVASKIATTDIDDVRLGQNALLRFTAFDQRHTPELEGYISKISADSISDTSSGQSYYSVELLPQAGELDKLGDTAIIPGMPVEALIKTDERTPLSYVAKPLTDYFTRSFRG